MSKIFLATSVVLYLVSTNHATQLPLICSKCDCADNMTININCDNRHYKRFEFNVTELWQVPDTGPNFTLIDVEDFTFENNLINVVTQFPALPIRRLNLKYNQIMKIEPGAFMHLQQMVELDLSHNELADEYLTSACFRGEVEPEDPEPMQSLLLLRLSGNYLTKLRPDVFEHLDRLETLQLDHNSFETIDKSTAKAIRSLDNLKVLDLSYTGIKTLPQVLLGPSSLLTTFNLTGNEFERVPTMALSSTQQLEWLSLSGNPIESLSGKYVFPKMKSLKYLFLNEMKLRYVGQGAFSGLPKLEGLSMKRNEKLEYIDKDAFVIKKNATTKMKSWTPIKRLELDSNKLSHLDQSMLGNWGKLDWLDLRNNPWMCACENQWMITTLVPMIAQMEEKSLMNNLKCSEPSELAGMNFSTLSITNTHLHCIDPETGHPDRDVSILVGVLIGILLTIPTMMGLLLFCAKKNFYGYIQSTRSPAAFTRTFYNRAESLESDRYI